MAEPVASPRDLLVLRLRTMLWIEVTLADDVLPELLDAAHAVGLTYAFERHLLETREHVRVLRDVLDELGVPGDPVASPALEGLVKEHEQLVARIDPDDRPLRDLAHAEAAAHTEHLELSSYDALASLADALGEEELGLRLRELMEQEQFALEQVERALTKLLAERVSA